MEILDLTHLAPPFEYRPEVSAGAGLSPEPGWLADRGKLDWPFLGQPVPEPLRGGFVDMRVSYDASLIPDGLRPADGALAPQIKLSNATIGNAAATAHLVLKFEDGTTLIDTASAAVRAGAEWGHWKMFQWQKAVGQDLILLSVTFDKDALPSGYSGTPNQVLSGTVSEVRPRRVTALKVKDGMTLVTHTLTGFPLLSPGYNMTTALEGNVATLACSPGAGLGLYQDGSCTDALVLRRLNGLTADESGNLNLDAKDCYWLERPMTVAGPGRIRAGTLDTGTLTLHNSCRPCISCDDINAAYTKLHTVWQRTNNTNERMLAVRDTYNALLTLIAQLDQYLKNRMFKFDLFNWGDGTVTFQVTFRPGARRIKDLTLTIGTPTGYATSYAPHSGWEQLPGGVPTQNEPRFTAGSGTTLTINQAFSTGTVSFWQWTLGLRNTGLPPGASTDNRTVFTLSAAATEILDNGTTAALTAGPIAKSPSVAL